MTTELALPVSVNPMTWNADTEAMLEFAGLTWMDGATRKYAPAGVTAGFIAACNRTGLDPTTKQIYAVQFSGKWTVLVGVDGMRAVAQRSHEYGGQTPIQWTADGTTWVDAWLPEHMGLAKDAKPVAARVGVYRKGFTEPLMQVVTWAEFGMEPRFKGDNWGTRPAHMLGIRAETHALRRAFPNDLSGLYTAEDADAGEAYVIEPTEDWEVLIEAADTKEAIAEIVERARLENELTDRIRTAALTRYGMFNRDEVPAPAPELDPADPLYVEA
jgi:phage recombination protein Bet